MNNEQILQVLSSIQDSLVVLTKGQESLRVDFTKGQESLTKGQESLSKGQESLSKDQELLRVDLTKVQESLGTVKRTVSAIEAFPVPYGRPKTFVAATEFHSVSNPVKRRQGHIG